MDIDWTGSGTVTSSAPIARAIAFIAEPYRYALQNDSPVRSLGGAEVKMLRRGDEFYSFSLFSVLARFLELRTRMASGVRGAG